MVVLLACLLCFLRFLGGDGWREACLRSVLLFGAAATVLTEVLGAVQLLRRVPLILSWSLLCVAATWWGRGRSWKRAIEARRWGLLDFAAVAGVAAIALLVGCTAVFSPPNSTDAMAYHLPRVVYWAQAGSVSFFPVHYYNQIMLPPLAEYIMLHTYVLSGGDRFINLVQFLGFLGSVLGVSLIAQVLGAGNRGQAIAALFCATLPNGILQASGAKNDYLLSLWLVAMVYFALRFTQRFERADLAGMSAGLGLALLTKGTAYIFAPAFLAGIFAPVAWRQRDRCLLALPVLTLGVIVLNGPQYWRNWFFSGSVLGYDSAYGDGQFRWRNESPGLNSTISNILRNVSQHLGARSPSWNQGIYDLVVQAHQKMGIDPNDPATTWRWTQFEPPANSNHEASAPNRWHLLLLVVAAGPLGVLARRSEVRRWLWYYLGGVLAFVLFCFYLKWMPWITRLHLPLFVLGSPIAGLLVEKLLPAPLEAALVIFLLNNSRPYVFENWIRPLKGPHSLFKTARDDNYFSDMKLWNNKAQYLQAVALTRESGCLHVGIDNSEYTLEYPFQVLLLKDNPAVRFLHAGVTNRSATYPQRPAFTPCAVLCLDCAGNQEKIARHRSVGEPIEIGRFLLFLRP